MYGAQDKKYDWIQWTEKDNTIWKIEQSSMLFHNTTWQILMNYIEMLKPPFICGWPAYYSKRCELFRA